MVKSLGQSIFIDNSGNTTVNLNGTIIKKDISGGIVVSNAIGGVSDGRFNNLVVINDMDISGNLDISNNLTVSGNLDISNNLTVSGNLDISNNLTVSGNATVIGNLNINGTTTTVNSTTVTVVDPIITLGSDLSDNKDRGIEFRYNDGINKRGFFGFDNSTGNFIMLKNATNTNEIFSGTQGTLEIGNLGIGTSNPQATLDVSGNIFVSKNIGIGTNNPQTSLDVSNNVYFRSNLGIGSSIPSQKLDIVGNMVMSGNFSANNMAIFRNRIINGDMRLDQRNVGYASGSNGLLTNNSGYGVDRWKVINTYGLGSIVQKQVVLSGPDAVSVGSNFSNAVSLTATNQNGLVTHIPFDGSSPNDIFNSLVNPLSIGTGYSTNPVRIGTHCIDCTANTHSSSTPVRYVNYTLSPFFQNITTCSFSLWIYTTIIPVSGQACCFGLNTTTVAGPYLYLNTSSQLVWAIYSSAPTSYTVTASSTIAINTWYHVVCTLEAGTAKIYINAGTPVSTAVSGFLTNGSYGILTGLTIGALTLSGGAFKGYIDDFRVYNRALTLGEINMLYSATDIQNINQWVSPINPYINVPFDNSTVDLANTLTNIVTTGVLYATSPVIVGTHSLNLTANTGNGAATAYITATTPSLTLPLTISCWIYASAVNLVQAILSFGGTEWAYIMNINASGQVYADAYISGTNYNTPPSATSVIVANVWYHLCSVITPSGSHTLYLNGTPVGIRMLGAATTLTDSSTGGIVNVLNIGRQVNRASTTAYKGYIDNFRVFNRALTYLEVAGLATPSPLMFFPFEGNLTDSTGNGNTLTTTGTMQYVTGHVSNQALYLANEANVIATPTASSNYIRGTYTFPSTFTISLWFLLTKINSTTATVIFITNSNTTTLTNSIFITQQSSTLFAGFYNGTTTASITATINIWYNATVTYNNGTLMLYVNGSFVGSTTGTIGQNNFMFSNSATNATQPFAGYIDDFRIYNTVLTATQIAQLYYSYTPNQCVLYQQPIEGYNIYDLGLGTSASQPITASCWLKNNTSSAQTFSLSINNNGLIGYLPFENSYVDVINTTLSQPVRYGNVTFSNSVFKVGTHSVYFNQTPNIAPTQYLSYTIPANMQPQTVAFWFNPSTVNASSGSQFLCHFGSTTNTVNDAWNLRIVNNTQILIHLFITGYNVSSYFFTSYNTTLVAGTWYHCAVTFAPGGYLLLYFNGILVGSSQFSTVAIVPLPTTFNLINYTQGDAINCFQIGGGGAIGAQSYHGYIDDFRIYNRPLTAAQIYQLYINNASSTTITDYLLARSYIYNTPTIAAGTWQKIVFTIPAETIGYWGNDNNPGLLFSLCLGSNSTYAATPNTWNSITEFTGTGVQILNDTSTNFMAINGNNILITGVQLERGDLMTPFEFRPFGVELGLCQRYYHKSYDVNTVPGTPASVSYAGFYGMLVGTATTGYLRLSFKYPVEMRSTPIVIPYDANGYINSVYKGANGKAGGALYVGTQTAQIGTADATSAFELGFYYTANAEL